MSTVIETIDFGEGIYEGETVDGVMHGYGTARWVSGDTYTGEWRNDVFHGRGVYKWADGDQYNGEYQEEKQHGEGTLIDSTGTYVGQWANDVREGFGKQTYVSSGDFYEGEWHNDMRHGKGKQVSSNGAVYEGEWLNDQHHGVGMARNANGDVYEGEFFNNKANGKGTYRWSDGASYVGYFRDGLKHGEGCERMSNGNWVAGNWINGEHDKKQPVHCVDPMQMAEHQRLLEETLARLNIEAIKPKAHLAHPGADAASAVELEKKVGATAAAPVKAAAAPQHQYTEADFAGWQIMKMLGKGSFGAVYEAGLPNGKIVCVKIVELGALTDNADMKKLNNEINLMKRLHHPNIVQYYGCVEDKEKNSINIFMEYVTGGSLNHYIKRFKKIPLETVRQWAYQMVCGVKYLHDQGIVHRDLKGDNCLVTMEGVLKLADFGCSKEIDDVCSKTHGCRTMVGTPYWMAPEVVRCEDGGYGMKSDVWSVGCTVVEMVTGKPPWPECNSMWAAVYKIANSTGPPSEIPKDLDPVMMDFLECCFERDPAKRASSAELLNHQWLKFD